MNAQTQRGPPTEDEDWNPPVHARDGPEQVVELSLTELYPFKNHPFHVVDDVHMESTAQSIKSNGVLVPVIVRPRAEHYVTSDWSETVSAYENGITYTFEVSNTPMSRLASLINPLTFHSRSDLWSSPYIVITPTMFWDNLIAMSAQYCKDQSLKDSHRRLC